MTERREVVAVPAHRLALMVALVMLVFVGLLALAAAGLHLFGIATGSSTGWRLAVTPLIYALLFYVLSLVFALIYNALAARIGGIRVVLSAQRED